MGGGGTEREGEGEGERQMTQPHTIQCVTLQKYEAHFPASQGVVPAEYGGGSVLAGEYERQCRHHAPVKAWCRQTFLPVKAWCRQSMEEGRFWRESMRDNAVIIRPLRVYAQEMCQLVTQAAGSRGIGTGGRPRVQSACSWPLAHQQ